MANIEAASVLNSKLISWQVVLLQMKKKKENGNTGCQVISLSSVYLFTCYALCTKPAVHLMTNTCSDFTWPGRICFFFFLHDADFPESLHFHLNLPVMTEAEEKLKTKKQAKPIKTFTFI